MTSNSDSDSYVCKNCGQHVDCPACNMYICPRCGSDLVNGEAPVIIEASPAMKRLRGMLISGS